MRWIVVLIFVIAGPPLGVALLWGLNMLLAGQLIAPIHVHLFLFGAYVFGGLPALAAGLFVARHENPSFWRVLRIGVSVGLVVAVFLAMPQSRFVLTLDAKTLSVEPASLCGVPLPCSNYCLLACRSDLRFRLESKH
jgi:hypothetical protein